MLLAFQPKNRVVRQGYLYDSKRVPGQMTGTVTHAAMVNWAGSWDLCYHVCWDNGKTQRYLKYGLKHASKNRTL